MEGGCFIQAIKQFPLGDTDVKRESYIFLLIKNTLRYSQFQPRTVVSVAFTSV